MTNTERLWGRIGLILLFLTTIGIASSLPLAGMVSSLPLSEQSTTGAKAIAIVTGANHSCALTEGGSVKCWGLNDNGQLGDGTISKRNYPVQVLGLESGVRALAAGAKHTCAVLNDNSVKCWGANERSQLGNSNANTYSTIPVEVSSVSNVAILAAGGNHSCIVSNQGKTRCWGSNLSGELGDGNSGNTSSSPVRVEGLSGTPIALALGDRHSCAIVIFGIQCWGDNNFGQLGNGTKTSESTPVSVSGIGMGVLSISAALNHTCAVTSSGAAKCWGANYNFQLGDGTGDEHITPTAVLGLQSGIKRISAFWEFTCALTNGGAVKCWGKNDVGNLGDNSATNSATAVDVLGLSSGTANIATGQEHACALLSNGGIKCWGRNNFGQRGDGRNDGQTVPLEVDNLADSVELLAAGGNHSCVLEESGSVECWGRNTFGQLGDGTTNGRYTAKKVSGLDGDLLAVQGGDNHSCTVRKDGKSDCWGLASSYQLGNGSNLNSTTPAPVNLGSVKLQALSAGRRHTCALTSTGAAKCWGNNEVGQLGDGTTSQRINLVDVVGLNSEVTAISVGGDSSCALKNGKVLCWGLNSSGQLGDGTFSSSTTPIEVNDIDDTAAQVAIGWSHACALTSGGKIYCWGQNYRGQLGNNSTEPSPLPVQVNNINSGVKQILVGREHTCALVNSGVQCWGNNTSGQLGDGTLDYRTEPVPVVGLSQGVSRIASGLYHTCALMNNGAVKCWGYDEYGQLGSNPGWAATDTLGFGTIASPTAVPTASKTPTRPIPPTEVTATPTSTATATPSFTPTKTNTPTKSATPTPTTTGETATSTPTETPNNGTPFSINLPIISNQFVPTPVPRSWRRLVGAPEILDTLILDENNRLFVGVRSSGDDVNGIYRALDCSDNATFQQLTNRMNMRDFAFSGSFAVAGTFGNGLYFSQDSGSTWKRTVTPINDYIFSVLYATPTRVYAATDDKLYLSDDSGATWRLLYDGVDPSRLNELYLDVNTGILWIGTYDNGLWKLLPGAPTAQSFNDGFSTQSLEITEIVYKNGTFYIATTDGVYRGDGISAWTAFGLQGEYVLSLEIVGDLLYAGVRAQVSSGGVGKGIWIRPLTAATNWVQDTSFALDFEVNDLYHNPNSSCNALLAATTNGLWAYR